MGSTFPGCRALVRKALQLGQIPETAIDICLASVTPATLKQYNSGLKLWWEFCSSMKIDVFTASVPNVLSFLTTQYNKGASFGTLNSYRSAIAQILGPNIAQDIRTKRFFKGISHLRPSKPRYQNTWDPSLVLDFCRSKKNEDLSLEDLSHKLSILLALASGQRVQTLALIKLENISRSCKGIEIKIPDRVKTSGINKFQPLISLPFMPNDKEICVATTILCYIERTEKLRTEGVRSKNLFLTLKRPYHNATSQTISNWIKKIMSKSDIDTNTFKVHSTRHASTSAAYRKGMSFDTIRLAAGWSENSQTFAKFYNRPINDCNNFAHAVLSL